MYYYIYVYIIYTCIFIYTISKLDNPTTFPVVAITELQHAYTNNINIYGCYIAR